MAATDLVPCFYTGQNYRCELPAEMHPRAKVHEFRDRGVGKFADSGKVFVFSKQFAGKFWDGPLGTGNLLPFGDRRSNPLIPPSKTHYEVPMAGDRTTFARHRRHLIHVSSRSLFRVQALPVTA
jgi:hypothetical protein